MSLASGSGGAPFRVGAAVSRSFSVFFAGFWKFFLLMLAPNVVGLVFALAGAPLPRNAGQGVAILAALAQFATYAICQAACIYGAYQIMRKDSFGLGRALSAGSGRAASLFFASLLSGLLAAVAAILLVIPGIIVFCMLFVALPACVIERIGPVACLGRSRALTAGYRWPIFGLLLLVSALLLAGVFVFGLITGGGAALLQSAETGQSGIIATLLLALVGIVALLAAQAWGIVLSAVVYHDLRVAKEGVDIEQLANVFA